MNEPETLRAIQSASDILLAGSVVFVAQRFLRGYLKETKANRAGTAEAERPTLKAQAKLFYAEATFQHPLLILALLVGGLLKIGATTYEMWARAA
jgi:hypothetical protein